MSPQTVALLVALGVVASAVLVGAFGARGKRGDPRDFLVAGRSFGSLLLWLLLAGEIYTTFTFLGAAGWAYGKGAPIFYVLCYGPIAYIIGFFVMPLVWRVAKHYDLLTVGDLFAERYASKPLGAFVALVGFVFLVPYVTLQLTGLEVLLQIAGYGSFDADRAVVVAVIVMAAFVFVTGLRGTAWTSIAKDALVLCAVAFAGIALPMRFFGSPAGVIARVETLHPGWLTLHASNVYSPAWFVSTVLLTGATFFLWPQSMAAVYSAKSADALRRNYIFLPAYQIMLVLMIFAGLTALLVMPGLTGADVDKSFVLVVARHYPPWVLGAVAGAGCLAALVPVCGQLLAAAGLAVKNILVDGARWRPSALAETLAMRICVVVVAIAALVLWAFLKTTLVELLLIAYNGIAQCIPGVAFAFWWPRATPAGIAAGIATGILVLVAFAQEPVLAGINTGVVALAANGIVAALVSVFSPAPPAGRVRRFLTAARGESL
ncbi:MAG TPA: hypothetical protein VEJ20_03470 [Candidatus Eremiobacteraceae bacterium]|nr:hypothetical protein [Candidatus Eremiobacteraceae bacterium]